MGLLPIVFLLQNVNLHKNITDLCILCFPRHLVNALKNYKVKGVYDIAINQGEHVFNSY